MYQLLETKHVFNLLMIRKVKTKSIKIKVVVSIFFISFY